MALYKIPIALQQIQLWASVVLLIMCRHITGLRPADYSMPHSTLESPVLAILIAIASSYEIVFLKSRQDRRLNQPLNSAVVKATSESPPDLIQRATFALSVAYAVAKAVTLAWPETGRATRRVWTATLLYPVIIQILSLWSFLRCAGAETKARKECKATSSGGDVELGSMAEAKKGEGSEDDDDDDDDEQAPELPVWKIIMTLKPYFWPSKVHGRINVILTWFFVIGSKGASVTSPLFIARATNQLAKGNTGAAMQAGATYAALLLLSKIFREGQSLVYLGVSQAAFSDLAQETFGHVHKLSLNWHLKKKLGAVVRVVDRGISACNTLMKFGVLYLGPAIGECLTVVFMFFLYFQVWSLALVVLVCVGMYIYLTVWLTLWRKQFRAAMNKHDNKWHDRITDSLVNFETVKYFTNEDFERKRFGEAVDGYQKYNVDVQASLSLLNISQQALMNGCLAASLAISARAYSRDQMDLGDFVAVNVWIIQLFTPLSFLGSVYNSIVTAWVDLKNLSQLLGQRPDIVDKPDAVELKHNRGLGASISFEDVKFRYPGRSSGKGLNGVSFSVDPGKTVALVGHTGAGKTTIARLLFRFYDPLSGRVLIDGKDIATVTQTSLRQLIGVVPQDTVLFNDTIEHNIRYGKLDATSEELQAAADGAQLLEFIEGLPNGWQTVVGERGLKLSGGEKQRVAIARCLLKDPPIVVLDEATSALDSITERSVQAALNRLGEARTVVIIAHRLGTVRSADTIIVLDSGEVLERGGHDELLEQSGSYARMWEAQLRKDGEEQKGTSL